jgi:hypothetical protein
VHCYYPPWRNGCIRYIHPPPVQTTYVTCERKKIYRWYSKSSL